MDEQLVLDRYRLVERLAVGGSAEVWRAHDMQLDRPVAVKRLHPHLLPDESSRRRLAAEARAAASLTHPVIVDVYDVDPTGEAPALVMELVDGESLAALIEREGPLPDRRAAAIAADVAEALYEAHQRGVIHRDVKPGNVLVASDGRTRLVDFGIAHSLAGAADRLTMAGTVVGTLPAMAPEQLTDGPITPRTDLYGLGVVLHEALTGRPPYPPMPPVALAERQRMGPPPIEDVDPALASVVSACLAHDPADRPLHAGALAAALRAWLAGDPSAAAAMGPPAVVDTGAVTQAVPVVGSPAKPDGAPVAGATRPVGRGPRRGLPIGVAAAAGLVLISVLGLVLGFGPWGATDLPASTESAPASATPTAPAPSDPPWLAKLVKDVEKACGADAAASASADLAALPEDEAKDRAEEIVDACTEQERGNGRGNGNGNRNGNGNDD
ncbi:MAG: protein kinase [Chloroflexi bacterium]|nr:protein kinase [Chloroflexota bacterium]